jgi:hypothetical protein
MAQKVHIVLVDDVDGGPADETVSFGLDGNRYEIDLSAAHARELRSLLEPWTAHARRAGTRRPGRGARSASDASLIRAWAREHGYAVNERGRVSAEIRAAYAARSS